MTPTTTTSDALIGAQWFTASYSNGEGGMCVESAHLPGGRIAVRDSKTPHGPAFVFTGPAWTAFVQAVGAQL
ncbi:DUF397 domain-containing protein [Streptomyces sp. JV176]|uniref:DUF397 domain-containing protein n=1 Tax=Streptomyces sp. JV176 TaxID=858630 RepID=UPI002E7A9333|nr:DUF397 domain-containing protein [Streptomyces sp. JV176]MEE1804740.1 DUF397 domain-containing protein [Streptomyces sp. JV176]